MSDKVTKCFADICMTNEARAEAAEAERDLHIEEINALRKDGDDLHAEVAQLQARVAELEAAKNGAYEERNQCVALIARFALAMGWRAGVARTAIEGWAKEWHGCVYIDLPSGQVSWHYHDSHAQYFNGLPLYQGVWDGHDTPEKYRRVGAALPLDGGDGE